MVYVIQEQEKTQIKKTDKTIFFGVKDISELFTLEGRKNILRDTIKNDSCMSILKSSDKILDFLFDSIINNVEFNEVKKMLIQNNIPFFSLILNDFNISKKDYEILNSIDNASLLHIICNNDNLIKILSLCEKIDCGVCLNTTSISLEDYYDLLNNYDFSGLKDKNIMVYFQKYNKEITLTEVYNMSKQINMISKEIKKFNLSPFEQMIFVYDMVKRIYYVKEKEGEDHTLSRNLEKVIENKYMVCAGYITLSNAILKCLGHKVLAVRDANKKHRRGLVYLKDKKYNIDGVYVFDPTYDRRKKVEEMDFLDFLYADIGKEEDNYRYFALPFNIADKSSHIQLLDVLKYSFDDLTYIYSDDDINKATDVGNSLETLFSLIDEKEQFKIFDKGFQDSLFLNFLDTGRLEKIYNNFLSKFYVSDIDVDAFVKALYNVKRVEYYLDNEKIKEKCETKLDFPTIDSIDVGMIKKSVINRFGYIESLKDNDKNAIHTYKVTCGFSKSFNQEKGKQLGKIISPSYSNNSLKRDILNMRLVKTLKTRLNTIDK